MPTFERGEITTITRLRTQAQDAMKELATRLVALAERTDDLAIEARRILILSKLPPVTASQVDDALRIVGDVSAFVENWADCARDSKPTPAERSEAYGNAAALARDLANLHGINAAEKTILASSAHLLEQHREALAGQEEPVRDRRAREFDENFLAPAVEATRAAVKALCALADALCKEG